MVKGVAGRILEVDLGSGSIRSVRTNEEWVARFAGGAGYAARLLYEHFRDGVPDPFSPDNPLIVMTGPLTGTSAFGSKTVVAARSPLTGGVGRAAFSGSFGMVLKRAGYDGIVIRGSSEKPVQLVIDDGHAELRPATDLWGADALETSARIRKALGKEYRVLAIGRAGEKLVRIAAVVSSERRVAGRTGMGAVMGSKKLKAVAVRGTGSVEVHDAETLERLNKEWLASAISTPRGKSFNEYGTSGLITAFAAMGNLPVKHWTKGVFERAEEISGKTMMEKHRHGTGRRVCGEGVRCSLACERVIRYSDPRYGEYAGKGPEYETLAALGSFVLNGDLVSIIRANELCDRYGIDTISAGEVIAWAIEAFEKGMLTREDTGGLELRWGDPDLVVKLVTMIGEREGLGDLLAEGVKRASESIGRGSERIAMHVKGLEVPMHHPRLFKSMGLAYATSNRGACHLQGMGMLLERGVLLPEYGITEVPKSPEERARSLAVHQDLCAFVDSAVLCKFGVFGITDFKRIARVWSAVTGMEVDHEGILAIGRRVWFLERFLNHLMGMTKADDTLPERFVKEPLDEGPAKGLVCDDLDAMLKEFYAVRGLESLEDFKRKLKEVGLEELLSDVDKVKL